MLVAVGRSARGAPLVAVATATNKLCCKKKNIDKENPQSMKRVRIHNNKCKVPNKYKKWR